MKGYALGIALIGIAVLLFFLIRPYTEELVTISDLQQAPPGTKVYLEGSVSSERLLGDERVLTVSSIPVICDCQGLASLENSFVKVTGIIEEYQDARQVRVLKITVIE